MSYQVLARKWRPQQFDDVIGQPAVTRTLANAIKSGRIAQSFVFAGPRGVGKTTTARILARALNCEKGPTAEPCGVVRCLPRDYRRARHRRHGDGRRHAHADRQRARGDHLGAVDHAGEKPLQGLHHRRGPPALEPFVQRAPEIDRRAAAARRLHDGDDRALEDSRDRAVALAGVRVQDDLEQADRRSASQNRRRREDCRGRLGAAADGASGRRQHARRAERLRPGHRIRGAEVSRQTTSRPCWGWSAAISCSTSSRPWRTRRRLRRSSLSGRAVELGYDLRSVVRELSRVVRDLLVLSVDPSRIDDPEIASESERERLKALVSRFSREDLLRAFDVLSKAESDIRGASQPRYHLEMALLRWIHLRKLVPLTELLGGAVRRRSSRPSPWLRRASWTRPTYAARPARSHGKPRGRFRQSSGGPAPPARRSYSVGPAARRSRKPARSPKPGAARAKADAMRFFWKSASRRPRFTTRSSRRRRRSNSVPIE